MFLEREGGREREREKDEGDGEIDLNDSVIVAKKANHHNLPTQKKSPKPTYKHHHHTLLLLHTLIHTSTVLQLLLNFLSHSLSLPLFPLLLLPFAMDYQQKMLSVNCEYEQDDHSKLGAEFDATTMEEVDVSLEWLSAFVEECLSTRGTSLPPLPPPPQLLSTQLSNNPPTTTTTPNSLCQSTPPSSNLPFTHFPAVPGKARSKRRRAAPYKTSIYPPVGRRLCQLNLLQSKHYLQLTSSADPLLLQQTYWLADSELLIPHKTQGGETEKTVDMDQRETTVKKSLKMQQQQGAGSGRRCSHCQAQRTPQWRGGPLGPKTLCNACGVRYKKSGRLLPEYRPANSPTFVSFLHSNSHKRVMEMRMMNASSSTATTFPSS